MRNCEKFPAYNVGRNIRHSKLFSIKIIKNNYSGIFEKGYFNHQIAKFLVETNAVVKYGLNIQNTIDWASTWKYQKYAAKFALKS